jgi:hypothetical protein
VGLLSLRILALAETGSMANTSQTPWRNDPFNSKAFAVGVVDGSFPRPNGAAVQVKDIHSAARKLPAQLNLERMPAVVVNDNSAGTVAGCASMRVRVIAREVTHAIAVSRAGLRRRRDCRSLSRDASSKERSSSPGSCALPPRRQQVRHPAAAKAGANSAYVSRSFADARAQHDRNEWHDRLKTGVLLKRRG